MNRPLAEQDVGRGNSQAPAPIGQRGRRAGLQENRAQPLCTVRGSEHVQFVKTDAVVRRDSRHGLVHNSGSLSWRDH